MSRLITYLLIPTLFFAACSKEEEETEVLSADPSISFVSLDPVEVENFKNSVTLVIKYKDNNGDIGFDDPDEFALWVKDSRLDSADYYHVPPQSPPGSNIIIEGQLEIVLNSIFILGNGSEEIMTLSVKLKDRAGHWSNIITTPTITIKR